MNRTTRRAAGVAILTVAITAGLCMRVDADRERFSDPPSPRPRAVDISAVTVDNATRDRRKLIVTTYVDGFRAPGACCRQDTLYVYIDTRPRRPGPEFQLFAGQDVVLWRTRGWRAVDLARCDPDFVRLRHGPSRYVAAIGRGCLGNPGKIRVAVKVTRNAAVGSHDWAKARRTFLGWVNR
jgi:hypothetical protein